jgi:hypothetical protein
MSTWHQPRPAVIHPCVNGRYPTHEEQAPAPSPAAEPIEAPPVEQRDGPPDGGAAAGLPSFTGERDQPLDGGSGAPDHPVLAAPPPDRDAPREREPAPPTVAASEPEPDADLAGEPPDPAADMHAWLVRNWDAIKALEAAGRLPELAPPEPEAAGDTEPAQSPPPAERPLVHVRRGDRWNKPKMAEFLRQLAATHSVSAAARAVGMHRRSAYKLRARFKGQPFDIAWEAAFRHGYDNLAHAALELALEGEKVPHYYQGELMGTHRKRNPQLIVQLLKMRNRGGAPMLGRYGAAAEWWGDRWDALLERVETGSVDWSDEQAALGEAGLAKLELPDAEREADRLIARNAPDEPSAGRRGP